MSSSFEISTLASNGSSSALMDIVEPRLKNPATIYLSSLGSEMSRKNLHYTINMIARVSSDGAHNLDTFPWHNLRREHILGIMQKLEKRADVLPKPSTLRLYLVVLKRIAEEAMHLDLMSIKDYSGIKRIKAPTGSRVQSGRVLNDEEIDQLMNVFVSRRPRDLRDAAIVGLMLFGGLRRSEVVSAKLSDIDWQAKRVKIIGKGNKERIIPLKDNLLRMLARYVLYVRGESEGALFVRITKDSRLIYSELSSKSIYNIVATRSAQAALGSLEPHDLRRTFATTLHRNKQSLKVIMKLLGHSSINTTENYIYSEFSELEDAVESLSDKDL